MAALNGTTAEAVASICAGWYSPSRCLGSSCSQSACATADQMFPAAAGSNSRLPPCRLAAPPCSLPLRAPLLFGAADCPA